MSIIIRLQNLPLEANSLDIRRFFQGLQIPDGGVHIVGGENGDAFIAFANDEDARQAMERNGNLIKGSRIKLLLSSRNEMQRVIDAARNQTISILPSSTKTTMNPNAAAAAAASVVPTNIPVQQSSPQKLPPPPSSSSIQPQQYPTHPIGNYPTTQYPPAVQIQPSLASSTNPVATSGYYPGGVGPSQTVRYPPPPPQSSSQTQPQSQPTPNDYQRSGPNVAYGHRQNDRQELQYRGRSRSRSRSPPTNRTGSDIHPSMNQRYSDMNKNTMQTGLIRSLQPSVSSSTSQISPSSSTQIHSSNFVPQTSGNNMDIRYTNYPQPSQQQQQESREYQSQQSFGGSQYRPMPGASNINNNTMMDGSLGGGGGDRGIVGGTGIGQQGITIQGGGVVGGGWNNNNNNNDNNNYRQTSVISNDFNNRKMDSIHQLPQQPQPLSSAYGQPSAMPMMPHQSQQQQQQQQQLIRPPTSQQQQQPPPPQQMFTLQLNDLPFNVKSLDLIKFFQPLYLDEDNIKIFYDSKGFPTGIALVRFGSPKEWEQALTFNNRYMGDRRIQVQPLDDLGNNNNNNNNNSNIGQNSSTIINNNNNNGPLLQQPPPPPLIANPPPSNSSASTTIGQQRKNTLPPPQSDPYRSSLDNYPTYRNSPEEIGSFGRGPPPPSSSSSLQQSSSQFNGGMGPPPPSSSSSQSSSSSSHHHNSSNHHHHHHHRGKYQPRCKDNALFMKGLPFANCTTKDVAHFFDPIKLFHIEIEFDSRNKPTGNAYVEFHDRQDVDHAMNYNMRNMGHRYIELIPWILYEKFGPTYHLPSAPPPPKFMRGNNSGGSRGGGPPPPPPPSYGGSGGGNHHHHQGPFTHCVLVRGLGKHVSTPDLKQFFAKSNIDTYAVHIMLTTDKMNAGEAFVEFLTKEDQNRALDMSGARLAGERVNIRPVAYEVVRASVPPPRGPPSASGMPSLPPNKSHGGKYRRGGPAGPRGGNNNNNGQSAPIFDKSSVLIMKNISFKTNIDDLCRFFDDYHITPNRIKIRPSTSNDSSSSSSSNDPNNLDGQEAQIQFHSRLDAEHAIRTLDKQYLHDRKIYLTFL